MYFNHIQLKINNKLAKYLKSKQGFDFENHHWHPIKITISINSPHTQTDFCAREKIEKTEFVKELN